MKILRRGGVSTPRGNVMKWPDAGSEPFQRRPNDDATSRSREQFAERLQVPNGTCEAPRGIARTDRLPEKYVLRYNVIWVSFEQRFLDGEQK